MSCVNPTSMFFGGLMVVTAVANGAVLKNRKEVAVDTTLQQLNQEPSPFAKNWMAAKASVRLMYYDEEGWRDYDNKYPMLERGEHSTVGFVDLMKLPEQGERSMGFQDWNIRPSGNENIYTTWASGLQPGGDPARLMQMMNVGVGKPTGTSSGVGSGKTMQHFNVSWNFCQESNGYDPRYSHSINASIDSAGWCGGWTGFVTDGCQAVNCDASEGAQANAGPQWFKYFDEEYPMHNESSPSLRMAAILVHRSGKQIDHKIAIYDGQTTDVPGVNSFFQEKSKQWDSLEDNMVCDGKGSWCGNYDCVRHVIVKLDCGKDADGNRDQSSCTDNLLRYGYKEGSGEKFNLPSFLMPEAQCPDSGYSPH